MLIVGKSTWESKINKSGQNLSKHLCQIFRLVEKANKNKKKGNLRELSEYLCTPQF